MKKWNFRCKRAFDIPVVFIGMEEEILNHFDKLYDNLRIVPSYNGLHWSKDYFDEIFHHYLTPDALTLIQRYRNYVQDSL